MPASNSLIMLLVTILIKSLDLHSLLLTSSVRKALACGEENFGYSASDDCRGRGGGKEVGDLLYLWRGWRALF